MTRPAPTQLLVFGFGSPEGRFEGRLGGALERAESGGALRIVRALFVGRDARTGELAATDLRGGTAGLVEPLLSFRLDPARRRKATAQALQPHETGVPPEVVEELGAMLEPGDAIVAVLIEHRWAAVLVDAAAQSGGRALADELVPAGDAAEFGRQVLAASARWRRGPGAPAGEDR
jgi:hypothetical protein